MDIQLRKHWRLCFHLHSGREQCDASSTTQGTSEDTDHPAVTMHSWNSPRLMGISLERSHPASIHSLPQWDCHSQTGTEQSVSLVPWPVRQHRLKWDTTPGSIPPHKPSRTAFQDLRQVMEEETCTGPLQHPQKTTTCFQVTQSHYLNPNHAPWPRNTASAGRRPWTLTPYFIFPF